MIVAHWLLEASGSPALEVAQAVQSRRRRSLAGADAVWSPQLSRLSDVSLLPKKITLLKDSKILTIREFDFTSFLEHIVQVSFSDFLCGKI